MNNSYRSFDYKTDEEELQFEKSIQNALIDENINAYQLQHLSNWIKNHNEPTVFKDKKIKDLKTLKREFSTFLENEYFEEFKISLEFKLKDQSKVA